MILVAVAALLFALVVVLAALGFVRWAIRAIERRDRQIEELRRESMERYARLVGQQLEATPAERRADSEAAIHQAERELAFAGIVADPEQAMEYPSPSEARFRERTIFAELGARIGHDFGDADGPLVLGPEVDAAR